MVVMGGHDWFQALVSAVGILGVASSDAGHDSAESGYGGERGMASPCILTCVYRWQAANQ